MRIESMACGPWRSAISVPSREPVISGYLTLSESSDRRFAVLRRADQIAFELRHDRMPRKVELGDVKHAGEGDKDGATDTYLPKKEPGAGFERGLRCDAQRSDPVQRGKHSKRARHDLGGRENQSPPIDARDQPSREHQEKQRL